MKKGIITIIIIFTLSSCGSVQSINGVRFRDKQPPPKKEILAGVALFGVGYWIGGNLQSRPSKK